MKKLYFGLKIAAWKHILYKHVTEYEGRNSVLLSVTWVYNIYLVLFDKDQLSLS